MFRPDGMLSWVHVKREYVIKCIDLENDVKNTTHTLKKIPRAGLYIGGLSPKAEANFLLCLATEPRYGRRLNLLRTKFELPSCQWWCTGIVELNLLAKGSGHGKFFWFCTTYHDKSFNRLKNTRFCTEGNNKPSPDCPSSSSICINFQHRSLSPLRSYRSSCGNTCKVFHATCTIINEVTLHL